MQISKIALQILTLAATAMAMPTASNADAGSQRRDINNSGVAPSPGQESGDPTPDQCRELCNCKGLDDSETFKCVTNPNRERCQDLGLC